jgi:lactate 2-monooxygenase
MAQVSSTESSKGRLRQAEIYLAGLRGRKPAVPVHAALLKERARKAMSREGFAYIAGGAGAERTMAANRAAFDRRQIVPRVLRDWSAVDLSIELLGEELSSPFLLAPLGVLELAHREADLAVARAAAAEGVPAIFSSQASMAMETCAAAMGEAPRWFQLYWSSSNELVTSFVRRAEACGCRAIVVTLDTKVLGWRTRDLDLAFLPFLTGKGLGQYMSDPVFQRLLDEQPPVGDDHACRVQGAGRTGPQVPGVVLVEPRLGSATCGRAPLLDDVLPPVARVGRPSVPARADDPSDPAQGRAPPR